MLKKSYVSTPSLNPEQSKYWSHHTFYASIIDDIDGNGFTDLVTWPSNWYTGVHIDPIAWTNTNGVFAPTPNAIKNVQPNQVMRDRVSGDFNGDGYRDYFMVDQGWELNGDPKQFLGSFPALLLGSAESLVYQSLDKWLTNPNGVRSFNHIGDSADYDRDGDIDVVVAAFWDFRIFENNGLAKFTWREDILPSIFNYSDPLIAVRGATGRTNDQVSGATFIELRDQYAIVAGDYRPWGLNHNMALNIKVLRQHDGRFVEAYTLDRPDLGFGRERNYGAGDMYNIDVNGDGREDLLVNWETWAGSGIDDGLSNTGINNTGTNRYKDLSNGVISIYLQDKDGKLQPSKSFISLDHAQGASPLHFEDFNLDGYVDFWTDTLEAHPNNFDKLVYINDGTGKFNNPKTKMFNLNEQIPHWHKGTAYFFDANNDNAIDVVTTRAISTDTWDRTIGQEVVTYLSDGPTYNITGNNKFLTVLADKTFDGGAGVDTAIFSGRFSDYTVSVNTAGHLTTTDKVIGRDGRDSFVNIERFRFDDGTVAVDINGNAGQIYRLYKAAFDRQPDEPGLGFWINVLDNGVDLKTVAGVAIDSPEFRANHYGDGSNKQFLNSLYLNVMDRAPDNEGLDFWITALENGTSRADVLVGFSESNENYANTMGLIGGGIQYQEWMF